MSAEMPDNVSAEYDQLKVELANVRAELDFFRANCCKWWSTLNSEEPVPLLDWIVEKTPIVLWAIDQQGIFRLSVGKALESLGLKPGEVVGRSAFEVYSDHPQVIAMLHRVLSGDSFASEVVVQGHFFEVECVPVRNTDGTQIGAVGVSLEVTRRRSAESQAAELSHNHDQNLQAMIDAVPEKALMIDADFTVLFANQRFSNHTGIPLEQLLGANIHNLIMSGPEKDNRFQKVREVIDGGSALTFTDTENGRWYEHNLVPLATPQGKPARVAVFFHDITDRIRAEELERERIAAELHEVVSEMLEHHHDEYGTIRDELRNKPLTPRETAVLKEIAAGLSTKQIAMKHGVAIKTIESQRLAIMRKLSIFTVAGLVRYAIRHGVAHLENRDEDRRN